MTPKKLLFLTNSLGSGGAERQTVDLINRMDRKKFSVSLAYFVRNETLKPLLREDNLAGLHCLDKQMRFDPRALMRLRAIIRHTQPDIVVCVNQYAMLYIYLLRLFWKLRFHVVTVLHSTIMQNRYNDFLVRVIYKHLLNRSKHVVFVCHNQMDYWIQEYGINNRISAFIYNGIDINFFNSFISTLERQQIRTSLNINDAENVICICASLGKVKRHQDLIDAGVLLRQQGHSIKILIVGDGPEREEIESHIENNSMRDSVIFAGFQHDVRPFLAISDIFTLCSSTETFSIAILEAMAMGKPIVAPAIGGIPEQVFNGINGFLFPVKEVNSLAENLKKILKNNLIQSMGNNSKKIVNEKFSIEKMVANYEHLLEKLD